MLHTQVFMHGESKLYTVNLHSLSRSTIIGLRMWAAIGHIRPEKAEADWLNWGRHLKLCAGFPPFCWVVPIIDVSRKGSFLSGGGGSFRNAYLCNIT